MDGHAALALARRFAVMESGLMVQKTVTMETQSTVMAVTLCAGPNSAGSVYPIFRLKHAGSICAQKFVEMDMSWAKKLVMMQICDLETDAVSFAQLSAVSKNYSFLGDQHLWLQAAAMAAGQGRRSAMMEIWTTAMDVRLCAKWSSGGLV